MAIDEGLFFARRLGFGLKPGEDLPAAPRDWAMQQIRTVPPLDFFGPDSKSIADTLPQDASPLTNFADACKAWGDQDAADNALQKKYDANRGVMFYMTYEAIPRWRDALTMSLTAVNGASPVFERFWHFWSNHFTVSTTETNGKILHGPYLRAIRARLTGSFADLLFEAIASPAMLIYLDNISSSGPHSQAGRQGETLNENLGRELLELHTVSPAAGYTQDDVIQSALVLTGWSFFPNDNYAKGKYGTSFNPGRHEPGVRTIMGKAYKPKGNGQNQLRDLINDLAVHPSTVSHISLKLARAFLSDDPPQDSVDRIAKAFADTNGDLVAVHSAVIEEVLARGPDLPKLNTPMNWLFQSYKVTGTPIDPAEPPGHSIDLIIKELGQPHDQCPQPNGWSELAEDWLSKVLLDRRVRTAYMLGTANQSLTPDALGAYVDRLMGPDSPAALSVKRAESMPLAIATLLTSPQFLWI